MFWAGQILGCTSHLVVREAARWGDVLCPVTAAKAWCTVFFSIFERKELVHCGNSVSAA